MSGNGYDKELQELCDIAERMRKRNEQQIEDLEEKLGTLEDLLRRTEDSADV